MGGSSKKGAPAQMGPATAGGPTPTLTQAQPFYPSYPSYSPQSAPNNIGLSIPTDINSLRQTAANQPAPMLVNRAQFQPRPYQPSSMVRQLPQAYSPRVSYTKTNVEPVQQRQTYNGGAYMPDGSLAPGYAMVQRWQGETLVNEPVFTGNYGDGGGGGSGWSSK